MFLLGFLCGSQIPFFPVPSFSFLVEVAIELSLLERAGLLEFRHTLPCECPSYSGVLYWSAITRLPHYLHQPPPNPRDILQPRIFGHIVTPVQHGPGRQNVLVEADADQNVAVSRTDLDGAIWVTGRLSTSDIVLTRMRDLIPWLVEPSQCLWRCEHDDWRRLWLQVVERGGLPFFRS